MAAYSLRIVDCATTPLQTASVRRAAASPAPYNTIAAIVWSFDGFQGRVLLLPMDPAGPCKLRLDFHRVSRHVVP